MAYIDWMIKGPKIGACSCAYGCPCEFNALPTHDTCEGLEGHRIDEGWFGDTRLDGLIIGALYRWPGPVHEGGGTVQGFISQHATDAQRAALFKILGGEEQEPTTVYNIYGSTVDTELDPVFADIGFACDFEKRTGHLAVPGLLDCRLEPIRNPVTGAAYFAQITLPTGFEFRTAECTSATFTTNGELAMDHAKSYGSICYAAYGPRGLIAEQSVNPVAA